MPEIKRATRQDVKPAGDAMARAFLDDPIYEWAFPDERSRLRRMIKMNDAMLPPMLGVDFMEVYTTPDHAGLALWAGPEQWDVPTKAMLRSVPGIVGALGLSGVRRFVTLMSALKKAHPKEPHWYLMGIGTDPPKQGTGVGTALISQVLDRCDREKLPSYLETQKPRNVPYYERFGYRVTGEIDPPLGAPHMWLMWRDPQ
jgi:GNAT superfamily N-acetyltransferase